MGKSGGKWIKTLLFGKKHSNKNDKKGELKSAVEDPASDELSERGVEKGTCACQCDAVGIDSPKNDELAPVSDEEARRQEAAYDAILVSSRQRSSIKENTDFSNPSTSYAIVPSKSNGADVALGRLMPKSSVSNLVKLTPSIGSMELLLNFHKFESGAGLLNTHHSTPQIDETFPPSDTYYYPKNNSEASLENGLSQRQNKAAFRMSVLEDYVDSDDDVPSSKEEPKLFEPIQPNSDLILSNTKGESPPPESHYEGEGSRKRHRRTRAETDESEMEEMNTRMDYLQVTVQELKEEQNTRWDEYTAHRLEDLQWWTDQSAHWANYYAHRQARAAGGG